MTRRPLTAKFRVYAERDRHLYFTVLVFADRAAMMIYFRAQNAKLGTTEPENFQALTRPWFVIDIHHGEERESPNMGQVLVHDEHLGGGVVAHEMTHAALAWARHIGLTGHDLLDAEPDDGSATPTEERVCWVVGHLVAQFWRHYYRATDRAKRTKR